KPRITRDDTPGKSDRIQAPCLMVWNHVEPEPQRALVGPLRRQLKVPPRPEVSDPLAQLRALLGQCPRAVANVEHLFHQRLDVELLFMPDRSSAHGAVL